MDHSHADDLGGQLRIVSRVVDLDLLVRVFTLPAESHGDESQDPVCRVGRCFEDSQVPVIANKDDWFEEECQRSQLRRPVWNIS